MDQDWKISDVLKLKKLEKELLFPMIICVILSTKMKLSRMPLKIDCSTLILSWIKMEFLIQEDQDFWCVEAQEAKEGLLNLNFVSDKDGIFDTNPYTFIRVL